MKPLFLYLLGALCLGGAAPQERNDGKDIRPVPFGDFEHWTVRLIRESAIVGGKTVPVYAVDDRDTVCSNDPYVPRSSQWGTSNAFSDIMGVVKTSVNVRPVPHRDGQAAEMRTEMMEFKVLGTVKVTVLSAGAVYLGRMQDPVRNLDDAMACIDMGIPFSERPQALLFDYRATVRNSGTVSRISGRKRKEFEGRDPAIVLVLLQRRREEDGQIFAERVATAELQITESCGWQYGTVLPLVYGKPRHPEDLSGYARLDCGFHAVNSRGESVRIQETGWADSGTEPTHLILYFASGSLGVFTGELGNSLCIDNIAFRY